MSRCPPASICICKLYEHGFEDGVFLTSTPIYMCGDATEAFRDVGAEQLNLPVCLGKARRCDGATETKLLHVRNGSACVRRQATCVTTAR